MHSLDRVCLNLWSFQFRKLDGFELRLVMNILLPLITIYSVKIATFCIEKTINFKKYITESLSKEQI